MANLSQENTDIFNVLCQSYRILPWYKRIFFPGQLGSVLKSSPDPINTTQAAWAISQAYLHHTWFFQRWFFSSLAIFDHHVLIKRCRTMYGANLLTGEKAESNFEKLLTINGLNERWLKAYTYLFDNLIDDAQAQENFETFSTMVIQEQENPLLLLNPIGSALVALNKLKKCGLLNGDQADIYRNIMCKEPAFLECADAFRALQENGLLTGQYTENNQATVIQHQYLGLKLARIIDHLKEHRILSNSNAQTYLNAIITHLNCFLKSHFSDDTFFAYIPANRFTTERFNQCIEMAEMYEKLPTAQADFFKYAKKEFYGYGAGAFDRLKTAYQCLPWYQRVFFPKTLRTLLTGLTEVKTLEEAQAILNAIWNWKPLFQYSFPCLTEFSKSSFNKCCQFMAAKGLLTGPQANANFKEIAEVSEPDDVLQGLEKLNELGLFKETQAEDHFKIIIKHPALVIMMNNLDILCQNGLLNGAMAKINCAAVMQHPNAENLNLALQLLEENGLLQGQSAQTNFDELIKYHSIFCAAFEGVDFWSWIPVQQLTQDIYHRFIEIARANANNIGTAREELAYYFQDVFILEDEPNAFNPKDSTHTQSVHQSVSESANRLMQRYKGKIEDGQLATVLSQFAEWVNKLPGLTINTYATQRAFKRLTAPNYQFRDPSSQITTQEFLALAWIAIHDDEKRNGTLEDAKTQLIAALYEIQREYNISDKGQDNGSAIDVNTCPAGAFNKIGEKLHGLHPDVDILIITREGASAKFRVLVIELTMRFFEELKKKNNIAELHQIYATIIADGNSLAAVWPMISEDVAHQLFEEYKSLYKNDKNDPQFLGLTATGVDVEIPQNKLQELKKYVAQTTITAPQGFFASTVDENKAIEHTLPQMISVLS